MSKMRRRRRGCSQRRRVEFSHHGQDNQNAPAPQIWPSLPNNQYGSRMTEVKNVFVLFILYSLLHWITRSYRNSKSGGSLADISPSF